MKSHEIDYKIYGKDLQIVEVELDPGEVVVAEAGAMSWMDSGITFEAKMNDGSDPDKGLVSSFFSGIGRVMTGESLFMTHFENTNSTKKQKIAFSSSIPGKILAINLNSLPNNSLICQKDSFLCAAKGTQLSLAFSKKIGMGFFGGEGFILQKLQGDGKAFLHSGGYQMKKVLKKGEVIKVETGAITAFTDTIEYDIELSSGFKSMLFGGEGIFLTTLKGPGTVILQSLPFSKLADRILKAAPKREKGGGENRGR